MIFCMNKGKFLGLQDVSSGQFGVAAGHHCRLHNDTPQRDRGCSPLVARDRSRTALSLGTWLYHSGVSPRFKQQNNKRNKIEYRQILKNKLEML